MGYLSAKWESCGRRGSSNFLKPTSLSPSPPRPLEVSTQMAEPAENRRAELIEAAQARWIAALTDMGGRNTLLYYKDRRASTLDLAGADPQVLDRFLRTGSIRLTRLYGGSGVSPEKRSHDVDLRAGAIRRGQTIYPK